MHWEHTARRQEEDDIDKAAEEKYGVAVGDMVMILDNLRNKRNCAPEDGGTKRHLMPRPLGKATYGNGEQEDGVCHRIPAKSYYRQLLHIFEPS